MAVRSYRFRASPMLGACLHGDATLEPGVVSDAVAYVQQALMDLGYVLRDYGPDGVFGDETGAAVIAFKAEAGLQAAAPIVDTRTLEALDARFTNEPEPPVEERELTTARSPIDLARVITDEAAVGAERYAERAVDLAVLQANDGAHHLRGAAGARPGENDGALVCPNAVALTPSRTDLTNPAVFAAECRLHGLHVCGGRFDGPNGGIAGGRVARRTDTDLLVYLAGLASIPPDRWQPFFEFFSPRRIEGMAVRRQVAWGEDCRGKRHFDGEGFVNWCMEEAVGARYPIGFDIATWGTEASGTVAVALTDPPRKGDIVIRNVGGEWTHIGFLVGDHDLGGSGALGHVVLAEQTTVGVVRRRFGPAGWTLRRRPTALLLHD